MALQNRPQSGLNADLPAIAIDQAAEEDEPGAHRRAEARQRVGVDCDEWVKELKPLVVTKFRVGSKGVGKPIALPLMLQMRPVALIDPN